MPGTRGEARHFLGFLAYDAPATGLYREPCMAGDFYCFCAIEKGAFW